MHKHKMWLIQDIVNKQWRHSGQQNTYQLEELQQQRRQQQQEQQQQ